MAKKKFEEKDHLHKHQHSDGPVVMSTLDLIKLLLLNKFAFGPKDPVEDEEIEVLRERKTPKNVSINHIAVILDGQVQEVIRAENRLAALLLSDPEFVEFDVHQQVMVGDYFSDGKFIKGDLDGKED
jgi:hypothetical protein